MNSMMALSLGTHGSNGGGVFGYLFNGGGALGYTWIP